MSTKQTTDALLTLAYSAAKEHYADHPEDDMPPLLKIMAGTDGLRGQTIGELVEENDRLRSRIKRALEEVNVEEMGHSDWCGARVWTESGPATPNEESCDCPLKKLRALAAKYEEGWQADEETKERIRKGGYYPPPGEEPK